MKITLIITTIAVFFAFTRVFAADSWDGSNYNQNSQPQKMWFEKFSSSLPITGNEDILDIGCGDGKLTLEITKRLKTGSMMGIDTSDSMIDFAQNNHKQENLSFSVGDARTFKINKKFDLIISFTALHWVKEYEQVIQRAKEHLKPNGRIYFVFSTKWQYFPVGKSFNALYATDKWAPYFRDYHPGYYSHDIDPYLEALIRHGFSVEEISLKSKLNIFETDDKLFSWLKAWIPQQHQVPVDQRDQFIREFIVEYSRHGTKNSKGIHWSGFLLKIDASLGTPMPQYSPDFLIINSKN